MRRIVKDEVTTTEQPTQPISIDSIPDISNRPVSLETVLNWIDLVAEVCNNDEIVRNN